MKSFAVAAFLVVILSASITSEARGRGGEYDLKRHEFFIGTGIVPGRYSLPGYNYGNIFLKGGSSLPGAYNEARYYQKEYTSGVWSAGYTCNFTKVLAVQANIFYEAGWVRYYGREDGVFASRCFDSYLSAMASFKVNWVNRKWVRMYSYAGLGLAWNYSKDDPAAAPGQGAAENRAVFTFQVTPVGIAVGRRFFGFAECGIGMYYSGISVGTGYRF